MLMVSFLRKHIKIPRKRSFSSENQLQFLKRLLRLLKNGYSLIDALEVIKWDKQMITTAETVINKLKDGLSIDQAFEQVGFHHTIIAYLYFSRTIGDLQVSIKKCIEMYESRLNYIKKIQQIIRYPIVLLFFFAILLYFIKQSILPSFIDLFPANSAATSTVLLSSQLIDYFSLIIIVFTIIFLVSFILWKTYKQKISISQQINFYKYIPIYNVFIRLHTSFLFATHLSSLLKTGMPLKDILHNMSRQNKLPIIAYYSSIMMNGLSKGSPISLLMVNLSFLEDQLTRIFQKNTHMNALEKDLVAYADLLIEELHRKVMKSITLIQPIFFIILASFIVFIYITLMWPMFQLINSI